MNAGLNHLIKAEKMQYNEKKKCVPRARHYDVM